MLSSLIGRHWKISKSNYTISTSEEKINRTSDEEMERKSKIVSDLKA
jgi:hypothetical protein